MHKFSWILLTLLSVCQLMTPDAQSLEDCKMTAVKYPDRMWPPASRMDRRDIVEIILINSKTNAKLLDHSNGTRFQFWRWFNINKDANNELKMYFDYFSYMTKTFYDIESFKITVDVSPADCWTSLSNEEMDNLTRSFLLKEIKPPNEQLCSANIEDYKGCGRLSYRCCWLKNDLSIQCDTVEEYNLLLLVHTQAMVCTILLLLIFFYIMIQPENGTNDYFVKVDDSEITFSSEISGNDNVGARVSETLPTDNGSSSNQGETKSNPDVKSNLENTDTGESSQSCDVGAPSTESESDCNTDEDTENDDESKKLLDKNRQSSHFKNKKIAKYGTISDLVATASDPHTSNLKSKIRKSGESSRSVNVGATKTTVSETMPTDTRNSETMPTDTRNSETMPTDTRNSETMPTDTRNSETMPTDTRNSETMPTDTRNSPNQRATASNSAKSDSTTKKKVKGIILTIDIRRCCDEGGRAITLTRCLKEFITGVSYSYCKRSMETDDYLGGCCKWICCVSGGCFFWLLRRFALLMGYVLLWLPGLFYWVYGLNNDDLEQLRTAYTKNNSLKLTFYICVIDKYVIAFFGLAYIIVIFITRFMPSNYLTFIIHGLEWRNHGMPTEKSLDCCWNYLRIFISIVTMILSFVVWGFGIYCVIYLLIRVILLSRSTKTTLDDIILAIFPLFYVVAKRIQFVTEKHQNISEKIVKLLKSDTGIKKFSTEPSDENKAYIVEREEDTKTKIRIEKPCCTFRLHGCPLRLTVNRPLVFVNKSGHLLLTRKLVSLMYSEPSEYMPCEISNYLKAALWSLIPGFFYGLLIFLFCIYGSMYSLGRDLPQIVIVILAAFGWIKSKIETYILDPLKKKSNESEPSLRFKQDFFNNVTHFQESWRVHKILYDESTSSGTSTTNESSGTGEEANSVDKNLPSSSIPAKSSEQENPSTSTVGCVEEARIISASVSPSNNESPCTAINIDLREIKNEASYVTKQNPSTSTVKCVEEARIISASVSPSNDEPPCTAINIELSEIKK